MITKIDRAILIDDERFDQIAYRRLLSEIPEIGEIVSFQYAHDALGHLRENIGTDRDVIFLDINMPRMNGFEFLEAANSEFGDDFEASVIVMLTTSLNPSDRSRAADFTAVKAFINKPLRKEHVDEVLQLMEETVPP